MGKHTHADKQSVRIVTCWTADPAESISGRIRGNGIPADKKIAPF